MLNLDPEAMERLLDPSRDPNEQVREDDWHPRPDSQFFGVDLAHTVAFRRVQLHNVITYSDSPAAARASARSVNHSS